MKNLLLALLMFSLSTSVLAQEIRFSRSELQQGIESYMPYSHQHPFFQLTINQPQLTLLSEEQRLRIRAHIDLITALGSANQGWLTLDGKLRYQADNHSFYIDDLRLIDLEVEGIIPEFKPRILKVVQELVSPLLSGQPLYTLKDNDMQEALAKMMLRSIKIENNQVVAVLSFF